MPEAFVPGQRLARELEQRAGVGEGHQAAPISKPAKRRTAMFSPDLPDTSLTRSPTVFGRP